MSAYSIQIQVDDDIHEVGGFDDADGAAGMAHVKATYFGSQHQPSSDTAAALEAGEKAIVIRGADPKITVLVS
ncbi:Uncharacterised protein (plasmid) [Tsukamurella tyrosinosolvens]|uniref:Uncharacterized protein n=1 Tax=Tsukamurella tyrosinosolvens TaxID=57704 RepID=A0A1H4UBN8_TSUTY|nr:hypothetical protein [Tsukamurella tyrosinosolvens]KXO92984.1 hypothetical protein AXK58_14030 [Tsukamurella tyrosinosolvens]SEC65634.1 hypothetical protein SAMN04489793_2831 [Tsukamurella tyrosinosolvens]VEH94087.1 Uncharacterised protein [Tsukamurella tyrosinosolvens]